MTILEIAVAVYCVLASIGSGIIESKRKSIDANPIVAAGFGAILFPFLLLDWATDPEDYS